MAEFYANYNEIQILECQENSEIGLGKKFSDWDMETGDVADKNVISPVFSFTVPVVNR